MSETSPDDDDQNNDSPDSTPELAGSSLAEQQLGRRVPPADAETAPGDATPRPDVHHRDPNGRAWDAADQAIGKR